jgi:hypothetical protein
MTSTNRKNVKMLAAIIGGSAVVAIGAMNVALTQEAHTGQDLAKSTTMTIGSTSTETTPPTAPAIGEAAPSIKGPAPLPSEEQGLP